MPKNCIHMKYIYTSPTEAKITDTACTQEYMATSKNAMNYVL